MFFFCLGFFNLVSTRWRRLPGIFLIVYFCVDRMLSQTLSFRLVLFMHCSDWEREN